MASASAPTGVDLKELIADPRTPAQPPESCGICMPDMSIRLEHRRQYMILRPTANGWSRRLSPPNYQESPNEEEICHECKDKNGSRRQHVGARVGAGARVGLHRAGLRGRRDPGFRLRLLLWPSRSVALQG